MFDYRVCGFIFVGLVSGILFLLVVLLVWLVSGVGVV